MVDYSTRPPGFLSPNALFGVANKIFFAALVTWLLATGHQLRTVARKAE
jgi:hypothetical protein